MRRCDFFLIPALTGLLMLAGCQGLAPTLQKPTAEVTAMRLDDETAEGGRAVATVQIENPNRTVLPLVQTRYTIDIEGVTPFRYTDVPGVALPSEGTQTLHLPAGFAKNNGSLAGRSYRVSGHATYRPPGEVEAVLYGSGWPLPRVGFSKEGTLGQRETEAKK